MYFVCHQFLVAHSYFFLYQESYKFVFWYA
jgi:hypothetical protein